MKILIPILLTLVLGPLIAALFNHLIAKLITSLFAKRSSKQAFKKITVDSKLGFIFLIPFGFFVSFTCLAFFINSETNQISNIFNFIHTHPAIWTLPLLTCFIFNLFFAEKILFFNDSIVFYQFFTKKYDLKRCDISHTEQYTPLINYRDKKVSLYLKDGTEIKTSVPISYINLFV